MRRPGPWPVRRALGGQGREGTPARGGGGHCLGDGEELAGGGDGGGHCAGADSVREGTPCGDTAEGGSAVEDTDGGNTDGADDHRRTHSGAVTAGRRRARPERRTRLGRAAAGGRTHLPRGPGVAAAPRRPGWRPGRGRRRSPGDLGLAARTWARPGAAPTDTAPTDTAQAGRRLGTGSGRGRR